MKKIVLFLLTSLLGVTLVTAQSERSKVVMSIDSRNYYIHTVEEGETLADISDAYSISEARLVTLNKLNTDSLVILYEGDILRVPCYKRVRDLLPTRGDDRFERYHPKDGESLYEVAVNYGISLDVLIEDNPALDITNIGNRRTLLIRKDAMECSSMEELMVQGRHYASVLQQLSLKYNYFVVEPSDSLYSIAMRRMIDLETFKRDNGEFDALYAGMVLKSRRGDGCGEENVVFTEEDELYYSDSVRYRTFHKNALTITMMLPMTDSVGRVRGNFIEFYQGALLAVEDMKAQGRSVNLQVYDTHNSAAFVDSIMMYDPKIDNTDIFIGPVYERNSGAVLEYAKENNIPVVSPLETKTNGKYGRGFFRMAPLPELQYDKINNLIKAESNVLLLYPPQVDEAYAAEVEALLGDKTYTKVVFREDYTIDTGVKVTSEDNVVELSSFLQKSNNVVFILSSNEQDVNRVMTHLTGAFTQRGVKGRYPVTVVGTQSWTRYRHIDRSLFFKLNVAFVANYQADRSNSRVAMFDGRYLQAFGRFPSTFAYRAYDAVKLFSMAMFNGGDLADAVNAIQTPMLKVPYHFVMNEGNMVNDFWSLVKYDNLSIVVE